MKKVKDITNEQIVEIYNYYVANNIGTRKIKEIFGINRDKIKYYFKKLNLPIIYKSSRTIIFNEEYFKNIDSKEKAYWLGFIFADGSICQHKNRPEPYYFELSLKLSDRDHLLKFAKAIELNESKVKSDSYRTRICLCSKVMCAYLIRLGCTPRKSLTLKFPIILKELEIDFIRGYFDGDGCIVNPLNHPISINCLGTESFLVDLLNIVKIENKVIKSKPLTKCYQFNLTGQRAMSFLSILYYQNSTIYLERKYYRYIIYFALRSRNITKAQGKFGEVLRKCNLDNTERLALEYLLKMQSL